MLTSGLIKSNIPRLPKIPPGLAAASWSDCAAFAVAKIVSATDSRLNVLLPLGPFPITHCCVLEPKSATGKSQLNAFASPNIPSAFDLNIPTKSPSNIFDTPFIRPPSWLLIPFIMSLNIAPTNWSPIQSVKFLTLSKKLVSILRTEPNKLSVIFFAAQGKKFWRALTGPTIAVWAKFAAFFAIAPFWVANNILPYTSLYILWSPVFNLGAKSANVLFKILPDIPEDTSAIFLAAFSIRPVFSLTVATSKPSTAFCNSDFILLTGVFWLFPAKLTTFPRAPLADLSIFPVFSCNCFACFLLMCLTDFWASIPDWSPTSFFIIKSLDFILLVYPVKGTKGCWYSPLIILAACLVFAKTPIITGCWASSPSMKNPKTLSPGNNLIDLLLLPLPEPDSGESNTCAQGNCSLVNSTSLSGWYPNIRTLIRFPQPAPFICLPCASSGAIWPTHHLNPSLPKKLLFKILFSIIFL